MEQLFFQLELEQFFFLYGLEFIENFQLQVPIRRFVVLNKNRIVGESNADRQLERPTWYPLHCQDLLESGKTYWQSSYLPIWLYIIMHDVVRRRGVVRRRCGNAKQCNTKGQIISKQLLASSYSSKKRTNKFVFFA